MLPDDGKAPSPGTTTPTRTGPSFFLASHLASGTEGCWSSTCRTSVQIWFVRFTLKRTALSVLMP